MKAEPTMIVNTSHLITYNRQETGFFDFFFYVMIDLGENDFCHLPTKVITLVFFWHMWHLQKAKKMIETFIFKYRPPL